MLYCFAESPSFFCSKSEIDRLTVFLMLLFPNFFSTHLNRCFVTPERSNLQNDKKIAQPPKMIQKRIKLFGGRNHFSSTYSSGGVICCCKNPEQTFSTKVLTFFSQSPKKVETLCNFSKINKPQNLRKYVGCSFDKHFGIFSLNNKKKQKNFAQNPKKLE